MKVTAAAWVEPASKIDQILHDEYGTPSLPQIQLERFARHLDRLNTRKGIAATSVPSNGSIISELEKIKASIFRIKTFVEATDNAPSKACDYFGRQTIYNDLKDEFTLSYWLDFTPQVYKQLVGLIDDVDSGDFHDKWFMDVSGIASSSTSIMGDKLPELFSSLYPNIGFGGSTSDGGLKGAGYRFVQLGMVAIGHQKVIFRSIKDAMSKVRKASK